MQRDGCLDALDDKHLEGPLHTTDRFRAIAALDDEFGNQRVIVRGYDGIGVSRRIHAHPRTSRRLERRNAPCRSHPRLRILDIRTSPRAATRPRTTPVTCRTL